MKLSNSGDYLILITGASIQKINSPRALPNRKQEVRIPEKHQQKGLVQIPPPAERNRLMAQEDPLKIKGPKTEAMLTGDHQRPTEILGQIII